MNGRAPVKEAPRDRPFIARNLANRVTGSPVRVASDHLAFFDPEAGHFVRLRDDLLREPIFIFFHLWRDIEP